jgi:hypothetical protein
MEHISVKGLIMQDMAAMEASAAPTRMLLEILDTPEQQAMSSSGNINDPLLDTSVLCKPISPEGRSERVVCKSK